MNPFRRAWASLKSFTMRWSRAQSFSLTWLAGTKFDYESAAGDGRTNAAVMACVRFVQRALPEAPLRAYLRNAAGELEPADGHPLQARLDAPNPYYSGLHLIGALVADLMLTGNAYVLKVRNGRGGLAELWWTPSSTIEPRWPDDGSAYISHYEYAVDGRITDIPIEDVVHIRQGFDPRNIRKGLSDLEALFREIATDNEAANWTASMVRNVNPPGVIISPSDKEASPSQSDLEEVKTLYKQRFGGDNRGEPLVMRGPTNVQVLSFSPEQMNLREIRNVPEERITAVFGLPAAVVGLGTGLEQTKVGATMRELREQAYESCLIPLQRLICAELQTQLVPDFGDPNRLLVRFDLSEVRVLQDDQNGLHERVRADWLAGLYTLNDALQELGLDPIDGEQGDIRVLPNTVTVKTPDTLIPDEEPAPLAEPTPLRALPAPSEEGTSTRALPAASVKAAGVSDEDILARYEAGLAALGDDLAEDLMAEFVELVDVVAARYQSSGKAAHQKVEGDAIDGLVTVADHDSIRRLLRGYVLKSVRQAAEDLAPLTGGSALRIQRNSPVVRDAVAAMEARLPGIAETTAGDFGRLLRQLERRPGSVSLAEVRAALLTHVEQAYPGRAETIARTELGQGHRAGTLHVIERAGLSDRVAVHDGDGDPACSARNGTTVTLEEARSIGLLHPRCRLRLTPAAA